MDSLAVHKSLAQKTVDHMRKHGIPARLGAVRGDAVDIDGISPELMKRAIDIASDISSDGQVYSALSNAGKWRISIIETLIPLALGGIVFLFLGASWFIWIPMGLYFVWIAIKDARGMFRSSAYPLPKQSWESQRAYQGRRTIGKIMAPFPAIAGCLMVVFLVVLFGFLAWLTLEVGL